MGQEKRIPAVCPKCGLVFEVIEHSGDPAVNWLPFTRTCDNVDDVHSFNPFDCPELQAEATRYKEELTPA